MKKRDIEQEIATIRADIEAGCVSYSQLARLEELSDYIPRDDVLLLEWAGVPELPKDTTN